MSYAEVLHRLLDYIKHVLWMSLARPCQAEAVVDHGEGTSPVSFANAPGNRCSLWQDFSHLLKISAKSCVTCTVSMLHCP
jgi:hypothetical protein